MSSFAYNPFTDNLDYRKGTGGLGGVVFITGNSGGPVESDGAGNFNFIGHYGINFVGNPGTNTQDVYMPTGALGTMAQGQGLTSAIAFSTATWPSTTTINQILYSSANNTVVGLATGNNGVLITGTTGIPSFLANGTTGQYLSATTGSPPSWKTISTTDLHVARYIVSPGGSADGANYTTIASAITAAAAAGGAQDIHIQPGTYTENLTLQPNINLVGYVVDQGVGASQGVLITGKLSYSGSGNVYIGNISITTNGDYCVEVTGSNASSISFRNCTLYSGANTLIHNTCSNASAVFTMFNCRCNLSASGITMFTDSSAGIMQLFYCFFGSSGNTTTASTKTAGTLQSYYTEFDFPLSFTAASGSFFYSRFQCQNANVTCITTATSGSCSIQSCCLNSGTASALSIGASTTMNVSATECNSTNATTIGGAGTCVYTDLCNVSAKLTVASTTITPRAMGPRFLIDGGTASLPAYSFYDDATTGIYSDAASNIKFATAGSNRMTVSSSLLSLFVGLNVSGGNLTFGQGFIGVLRAVAGAITGTTTDYCLVVTSTASPRTVTVPNASNSNQIYVIKDGSGGAATNNITVTTPGGTKTFDGATSYVINTNYGSVTLIYDGTNYLIIGKS